MDSETLPDELVLGPSRFKWIGAAVISLIMLIVGVFLIMSAFLLSLFLILFFGGGLVVSIAQMSQRGSRLHLKEDGFEQTLLGKTVSYSWKEVSEFGVWGKEHGFNKDEFVSFEYVGKSKAAKVKAGDGHSTLGDTFGKEATELAALMNAFRARALGKQS